MEPSQLGGSHINPYLNAYHLKSGRRTWAHDAHVYVILVGMCRIRFDEVAISMLFPKI